MVTATGSQLAVPERIAALPESQAGCVRALARHHGWSPGCGWNWSGPATTRRILDVLVRKGFAVRADADPGSRGERYWLAGDVAEHFATAERDRAQGIAERHRRAEAERVADRARRDAREAALAALVAAHPDEYRDALVAESRARGIAVEADR